METVDLSAYTPEPLGRKIPNEFPTVSAPYRIAIIGEAPGKDEDQEGRPFVGAAGRFLTALLIDAKIDRKAVYIGNVCQYRPPGNQIYRFPWRGRQIQDGIQQLREDMERYKPHLVVLLGNTALRAAKGSYTDAKGKEKFYPLGDWRGSLFISQDAESPFYGMKCIATYHPAAIFRNYSWVTYARFDLARARKQGCFPELVEPKLVVDIEPHLDTIITRLELIRANQIPISVDIEGGVEQGMSCLSISPTESEAFIIPFTDRAGNSYWSFEDECRLWESLAGLLEDPNVPKILQNAMYDRFVLAYKYKVLIRNITDDTMLKHWELYAELEKGLGVQTSIYTEHPYYKDEIHAGTQAGFWTYCCKDSAITHEINKKQSLALQTKGQGPNTHYQFNVSLLNPFLYIELKGLAVDQVKKNQRIFELYHLAHFKAKGKKKESGGSEQLKLEQMVGWQINVNSRLDMIKLLYEQLRMPPQYKDRGDGEESLTADYETLLRLGKKYGNEILLQCIKVRQLRKRCSDLESLTVDPDGRIRNSINVVGTSTGRTTSSAAPTGNGTNLHTVTSDDRDLIIADPGNDFCQCDLAGADGWTVAAHCARLGDATMLEDYLAGLKPAKILALLYLHGEEINQKPRSELKLLSKNINALTDKTNNFLYFACKRVQHGTNYGMGARKLSVQIFLDTEGAANIPETQASKLQDLYCARYRGVRQWQSWVENEIRSRGYLNCASGHQRLFFGRKTDEATIGQACSQEPQHNTTYVTNLALLRLWNDSNNRNPSGGLLIWPCHQIHDALCFQWRRELRDFAIERIRDWFNSRIIVAGQQLTIPFEGHIGPSWGEHEIEFAL